MTGQHSTILFPLNEVAPTSAFCGDTQTKVEEEFRCWVNSKARHNAAINIMMCTCNTSNLSASDLKPTKRTNSGEEGRVADRQTHWHPAKAAAASREEVSVPTLPVTAVFGQQKTDKHQRRHDDKAQWRDVGETSQSWEPPQCSESRWPKWRTTSPTIKALNDLQCKGRRTTEKGPD